MEKDGWEITHDPYILYLMDDLGKKKRYPIDLGAEKLLAAQKGQDTIAVEVKTFEGSSVITEYHQALGQYMDYIAGLEIQEPSRKLFLAVSEEAYENIMASPLAKLSLKRYQVSVLIFDPHTNTVIKWKK